MPHDRFIVPATPENIARAGELLRAGELVAFPTETVYGLGANALVQQAVTSIFARKGRPASNPVIVHIASWEMLPQITPTWNDRMQRVAEQFWPGPLTIIVPAGPQIPPIVTAGGATVGVRWPAHPIAQQIIQAAGVPIAAPSANRSGQISPSLAHHVYQSFENDSPLIIDGGPTSCGIESTVLDLTVTPAVVLRPGPIQAKEIAALLGEEVLLQDTARKEVTLKSPGLLSRHYAPRTPVLLAHNHEEFMKMLVVHPGSLGVTHQLIDPEWDDHLWLMPEKPEAYAKILYSVLHQLDAKNLPHLVWLLPENTPPWAAVRNRLIRAATAE
ncbi:MAG: L-threonylcarbamoyladenylate synthase [Zavarzinella sp.]